VYERFLLDFPSLQNREILSANRGRSPFFQTDLRCSRSLLFEFIESASGSIPFELDRYPYGRLAKSHHGSEWGLQRLKFFPLRRNNCKSPRSLGESVLSPTTSPTSNAEVKSRHCEKS